MVNGMLPHLFHSALLKFWSIILPIVLKYGKWQVGWWQSHAFEKHRMFKVVCEIDFNDYGNKP